MSRGSHYHRSRLSCAVALCLGASALVYAQGVSSDDIAFHIHELSSTSGSLSNPDGFVNRRCIKELLIADLAAVPEMRRRLDSAQDEAMILGILYVMNRNRLVGYLDQATLTRLFDKSSENVRAFVAELLWKSGDDSLAESDPAFEWRERAIENESKELAFAQRILDAVPHFTDGETERRIQTLMPIVTEAIGTRGYVHGRSPHDRAIALLADLGNSVVPTVAQAVPTVDDVCVKTHLMTILGRVRTEDSWNVLEGLLKDPSPYIRTNAIRAYADCRGAAAVDVLRAIAAADANESVRNCAVSQIDALMRTTTHAREQPTTVEHPTPGERLAATREWALKETERMNAEWNQKIQQAIEENRREKESSGARVIGPDGGQRTAAAGLNREGERQATKPALRWTVMAAAIIGVVVVLLIGLRIYATRRAAVLK